MDKRLIPVSEFLLVHSPVISDEESGPGRGQCILDERPVHEIDLHLWVLADVDVSEAAGCPLLREQHVEHKGVLPVVVPAPLRHGPSRRHLRHDRNAVVVRALILHPCRHGGIVFRGVQHVVFHELAVVQDLPAAHAALVVPVHHGGFLACVHLVVVYVLLGDLALALQLPLQLGVLLHQGLVVHQLHLEQVAALLDIGDPRLPEQVQRVTAPHGDVTQAAQLLLIPEHAVDAAAALDLLPPAVAVGLLEGVLLQDHRQDLAERFGLLLIVRGPGQAVGFRVVVHGVRVPVEHHVHQPAAGGLGHRVLTESVPVAHLPELLVLHDPLLQILFALLVLHQRGHRLGDLLLADLVHRRHVRRQALHGPHAALHLSIHF